MDPRIIIIEEQRDRIHHAFNLTLGVLNEPEGYRWASAAHDLGEEPPRYNQDAVDILKEALMSTPERVSLFLEVADEDFISVSAEPKSNLELIMAFLKIASIHRRTTMEPAEQAATVDTIYSHFLELANSGRIVDLQKARYFYDLMHLFHVFDQHLEGRWPSRFVEEQMIPLVLQQPRDDAEETARSAAFKREFQKALYRDSFEVAFPALTGLLNNNTVNRITGKLTELETELRDVVRQINTEKQGIRTGFFSRAKPPQPLHLAEVSAHRAPSESRASFAQELDEDLRKKSPALRDLREQRDNIIQRIYSLEKELSHYQQPAPTSRPSAS